MKKKPNRYKPARKNLKKTLLLWGRMTFALTVLVAGVVLLSAAFAHSYYALLDSPWFRLEEIDITGLRHLQRQEILNVLKVPRHANVLTLKMPELARRLESIAWLKSVVVRLELPRRIVVDALEREPLAVIYCGDFFLLDSGGKLFSRADIQKHLGLLLVTGFTSSDFRQDGVLASEPLSALKSFITALAENRHGLSVRDISECHWNGEEGFTIYTIRGSLPIQLGLQHFDRKLDRLQRILGLLAERRCLDAVTAIDLNYSNRAYVAGSFQTPNGI